jgi:addiction module RelE/StbE family toxin
MQKVLLTDYGESILDNYSVKLYARASRDLEEIFKYIANNLSEPLAAEKLIDDLENAIINLEFFPERGAIRQIGLYANKGYRQLFVKNYVIIYKVLNEQREVHVVTIRYAPSNF